MALLRCEQLTLGYPGRVVLRDLSFSLESGDYLCVVGENGSGKSTLMKTILGLQTPLQGEIIFGDGLKAGEIGYLPQQNGIDRDFPASVWEIVLSGCQSRCGLRPFYTRQEKQLAQENLQKLGLSGMERRCFRELSGGQQQRVLLARAICAGQRLLLLDEPVTGLDARVTAELYQLIAMLNRREKVTILMISHDAHQALGDASHILHLGESVFFGTGEEYRQSPLYRRLFTPSWTGKEEG